METNRKNWKPVTIGGFTGVLMGASTMQAMQIIKSMQAGNAAEEGSSVDQLNATISDDDMSFREAFNAARAELGPGGVFSWHGNLYNTYTADEWTAMTDEEKDTFAQQVQTSMNTEDIDVTVASNASGESDVVMAAEPANTSDDDVRVVGYGDVTLDNGQNITVEELDVNGQRVAVIDVDQDGEGDYAMSDLNHNRQMDEGEVIDLHTGEALSFTNDDVDTDVAPDTFEI